MSIKDYLGFETERNKRNAELFTAMVQAAFGTDNDCLIGHHITFEEHGDISTENEIPSADCLLFDHDVMGRIFGEAAPEIMQQLAALDVIDRDDWARAQFGARQ